MKKIMYFYCFILFIIITVSCCGCGKTGDKENTETSAAGDTTAASSGVSMKDNSRESTQESVPETALSDTPDTLYESKAAESTAAAFPDITEKSDWYGDYVLIGYVRPHWGFQPNPDKEKRQRLLDYQKQTILSLSESCMEYFGPVNREDDPEQYLDYPYDHYVNKQPVILKDTILDENTLADITERFGREYHLDGTAVDFSQWAFGDEEFFGDLAFRASDYQGSRLLVFYNEHTASAVKETEYWIDAGDGVVYSLTDQMAAKLQRLR